MLILDKTSRKIILAGQQILQNIFGGLGEVILAPFLLF